MLLLCVDSRNTKELVYGFFLFVFSEQAFKDMERCSGFTEQLPGFEDYSSDQMFFVHFALVSSKRLLT